MEFKLGKNPCPHCTSSDGFHFYGEGNGGFCFVCNHTVLSDEKKAELGVEDIDIEEIMSREPLTKEQIDVIKNSTSDKGYGCRGIPDYAYKAYYCRTEVDPTNGQPIAQYYPVFTGSILTAFKVRRLPKDFHVKGKMGNESDLFGQFRFKNSNNKKLLLTAGEVDAMSAYAMLNKPDSEYDHLPVVSAVVGETGSWKQLKNHYEWLNRFEQIIVLYDNDEAGQDAVKKLVEILPKGKMYVMSIDEKDANDMLMKGKEKQFVNAFWRARPYTPEGIVSSSELMGKVMNHVQTKKIPLPPFMHGLEKLMAGGIPLGVIVNLGGASGLGKSTIAEEIKYHWIFHSPYKIGILTLESDSGAYGTKILSRHLNTKIELIELIDEKVKFLEQPDVVEKANNLWTHEDGSPRFYLIEERDGGLVSIKEQIMKLIVQCDCQVIIIDPTTDLIDSLPNEEAAAFMSWQKGLVKSHKVTVMNILHTRKTSQGQKQGSQGATLSEEDFQGTSSLYKSAAANILISRNKEAESEIERNTMYLKIPKCRWTGNTAPVAGKYYYCNKQHTLYDFDDYFRDNPESIAF